MRSHINFKIVFFPKHLLSLQNTNADPEGRYMPLKKPNQKRPFMIMFSPRIDKFCTKPRTSETLKEFIKCRFLNLF